jgi:hypothetical protein
LSRIDTRRGRQVARKRKTEHALHNLIGEIRRKNSYSNDPRPPPHRIELNSSYVTGIPTGKRPNRTIQTPESGTQGESNPELPHI